MRVNELVREIREQAFHLRALHLGLAEIEKNTGTDLEFTVEAEGSLLADIHDRTKTLVELISEAELLGLMSALADRGATLAAEVVV